MNGWRTLAVAISIGVLVAVSRLAGQAATASGSDVLTELLAEVRGLRAAIEQMASSGPRVQLALGRLQLQEQRVNTLIRRLDEIRTSLLTAQTQNEASQQQLKMFEGALQSSDAEERQGAEQMLAPLTAAAARAVQDIQRLQMEEASTSQMLAAEQARWSDINRTVEELERSLTKR